MIINKKVNNSEQFEKQEIPQYNYNNNQELVIKKLIFNLFLKK